jgi:LysM repeat protein
MNMKHLLLVALLLTLAFGVTACRMPASTPPPATPTEEGVFPIPGTQSMGLFETIATQTAQAAQAGAPPAQETPVPVPATPGEAETPPPAEAPTAEQTPPPAPAEDTPVPPPTEPEPTPVPPTQPPVEVPAPTPGIPTSYTIQPGEHVYCIARRFNLNPQELQNLNPGSATLQPGQTLRIPQTGNTFPASRSLMAHPTNYTVRSGDTIYKIACAFGDVDPYAIAQANSLTPPYNLTPGQNLYIP